MARVSHHHWMQLAIEVAKQALPLDVPVGCVIVYNQQLIASAYNCREQHKNPAGHAEVLAMTQAARYLNNWRLTDCTLYVTLEPCPMCASLIQQARLAHVVYGAADVAQGACGSQYALWTGPTLAGVEEQTCQHLLTEFFAHKRKNTDHC
jgi:tRNA(adenine34) deaminase